MTIFPGCDNIRAVFNKGKDCAVKVKQFEERYKSVQERAKDIYSRIAPILKELKKLGREAGSLGYRANLDRALYKVDESTGDLKEDGWNIAVLHKLVYMDVGEEIAVIENALYGIVNAPFVRRKKGKR